MDSVVVSAMRELCERVASNPPLHSLFRLVIEAKTVLALIDAKGSEEREVLLRRLVEIRDGYKTDNCDNPVAYWSRNGGTR